MSPSMFFYPFSDRTRVCIHGSSLFFFFQILIPFLFREKDASAAGLSSVGRDFSSSFEVQLDFFFQEVCSSLTCIFLSPLSLFLDSNSFN